MCGIDAYGLNSLYSPLFVALSSLGTGLERPNDGLVSLKSCRVQPGQSFGGQASDVYYQTTTNHADITCRNGNGMWGDDRKPCNWFIGKQ
jgi:hypothetical protein